MRPNEVLVVDAQISVRGLLMKIHVAGPSFKNVVFGLLVDGKTPRLTKQMYKRIERLLYACEKFGLQVTATYEGVIPPQIRSDSE